MPTDPNIAKRRFIWRPGVLGFGLVAGLPWILAMWASGRMLPLPLMLGMTFGLFPLIGYAWASRLWAKGRG